MINRTGAGWRAIRFPALGFSALLLATLGGCGPNDRDPGPGGVTVGEARALDEAAAMLDARPVASEAASDAAQIPAN